MTQKTNVFMVCLLLFVQMMALPLFAQNAGTETKDEEYTRVVTERANKIVDGMSFGNDSLKMKVRNILVEHYRFLNDQQDARNADVAAIREKYAENKELRDAKIDLRKAEQEIKVRDNHFAFNAKLKAILSEDQIDQVKDGLTYGVLPLTYQAHLDMIPSLKKEEKLQIKIWLIEAREHAIDGGDSKEKHGWFGKYKGKINNYLSARGYDLTAERAAWEKRIKEKENVSNQ